MAYGCFPSRRKRAVVDFVDRALLVEIRYGALSRASGEFDKSLLPREACG